MPIRRQIDYASPEGKAYQLNEKTATLFVRPRGWHLPEKHVLIDGTPISGGIFDFALYFFHNAKELIARGTGPYFYLPKLESHLEARLWNDIFVMAQDELGMPRGTIKATVLIETILAAFEMDEILYELREHSAGLNCGRWDYIFSLHQEVPQQPRFLPRRSRAGDDDDALHALVCRALHQDLPPPQHPRDGRHGGADSGEERREGQRRGVRAGEGRQGARGDATATTAPGSRIRAWCQLAKEAFDRLMPTPNQIALKKRDDVKVSAADLLQASSPKRRSPKRACASTSTSPSSTSAHGSPARARCRSTT